MDLPWKNHKLDVSARLITLKLLFLLTYRFSQHLNSFKNWIFSIIETIYMYKDWFFLEKEIFLTFMMIMCSTSFSRQHDSAFLKWKSQKWLSKKKGESELQIRAAINHSRKWKYQKGLQIPGNCRDTIGTRLINTEWRNIWRRFLNRKITLPIRKTGPK